MEKVIRDASPTSPIQPQFWDSASRKWLICKGGGVPKRLESAVVKTWAIFNGVFLRIIGGRHVLARHDSPEGWQGAPLLEPCREQACERWARGATSRAVSGRDQFLARTGMAQVD